MPEVECEVCQTRQPPRTRCATCDMPMRLPTGVRPVADPPIEPLEGLEHTILDPALLLFDDVVEGLEPTHAAPVFDLPSDPVPGLEQTEHEDVLLIGGVDVVPGLESSETFERTTPESAAAVPEECPYCRFRQPEGRVCNACGRAKVRLLVGDPDAKARLLADERVRCRLCGETVPRQSSCRVCGAWLPD